MSKFLAILLSFAIFVTGTMNAQTVAPTNENSPNLKESVAKETEKLKSESAEIDVKKIEKMERQTPQKTWNTKTKLLVGGIVVGLVVLAVVLALTTKRCIKRSPSGCSFTDDIDCQCVEYAQ